MEINITRSKNNYLTNTAIIQAANKNRQIEEINFLIERDAIFKAINKAIQIASNYNHLEIVNILISDLRVDINKFDSFGWTPFHFICYFKRKKISNIFNEKNRYIDLEKKTTNNFKNIPAGFNIFDLNFKLNNIEFSNSINKYKGNIILKKNINYYCADGNIDKLKKILKNNNKFKIY